MNTGQLIVACDFGTTVFRALVTETTLEGGLRVLGCGEIPTIGFQDGDFIDMRTGSRGIARVMRLVEAAADVDVSAFYYNIAGSHLRSVWARGQVQVGPGPRAIERDDLEAVLAKARSLAVPFDNWILAVNPVEYSVDRIRGIVDPQGRIGSQLEVEAHLITGSRSVVHNIEQAINMAGYEVAGRAVDVLSAATALLSPAEQEEGVLLIDVGGRATNWALLRNDRIVGNGMVPWGGCHLTSDLAHGLRVSLDRAARIKRERGLALRSLSQESSLEALFEEERPEETPSLVAAILEPRLEEIFSLVKQALGDSHKLASLSAGVVLTGGGVRCEGSAALCEEVFGLPVQKRYLPVEFADVEALADGQWATAVGLSIWAAGKPLLEPEQTNTTEMPGLPFWHRIRGWLDRSQRVGTN
ncbi:MAG: cell division protein FtsA [bacterium]